MFPLCPCSLHLVIMHHEKSRTSVNVGGRMNIEKENQTKTNLDEASCWRPAQHFCSLFLLQASNIDYKKN